MRFIKTFDSIFKKKTKPEVSSEFSNDIIFNVDNFNTWFNNPNNNALYANPGIYLRLDKLSETHIQDYIEKCYNIDYTTKQEYIPKFYEDIRNDWRKKLLIK